MKEYCISFDVSSDKKIVTGLQISIGERNIADTETVNIALCEHPLYPKLEQYVLANPSKKNAPVAPAGKIQ